MARLGGGGRADRWGRGRGGVGCRHPWLPVWYCWYCCELSVPNAYCRSQRRTWLCVRAGGARAWARAGRRSKVFVAVISSLLFVVAIACVLLPLVPQELLACVGAVAASWRCVARGAETRYGAIAVRPQTGHGIGKNSARALPSINATSGLAIARASLRKTLVIASSP